MKRLCVLLVCLWFGMESGSAQAQIFFNPFRKAPPPPPPAERVGQLVSIIKSDPDERKRTLAVEEIRDFDTKAFPEIVPILADIAQTDAKPGVRAEAVSSLVRIRPVTQIAGQAIEHAAAKDDHWRNRMNAQAALVRYRLAGYSSSATARNDVKPTTPNQSQEPPIGDRPPIIYYDQNGKVIPAPKNMLPPPSAPGGNPVIGTPTSNPGGKTKQPFAPIGPAGVPQSRGTLPNPNPFPQSRPMAPVAAAPVAVEPVFRNANTTPVNPEPGPLVFTPTPAPTLVPNIVPAIPTATPFTPPIGPSLDLPPLPTNPTPRPMPVPAPTQGPSLVTSSAPSLLPSGRMEPSPRLTPATSSPTP